MRLTSIAQPTSASLALSMPTKKNPKPSARDDREPGAAAPCAPRRPPRARRAPRPRAPAPARRTGPPTGRSPVAIPTTTGTTAAVAEIGATTPMLPDREPAVEGREPDDPGHARERRRTARSRRRARASQRISMKAADQQRGRSPWEASSTFSSGSCAALQAAEEVGDAPGHAGGEGEERARVTVRASSRLSAPHEPRRGRIDRLRRRAHPVRRARAHARRLRRALLARGELLHRRARRRARSATTSARRSTRCCASAASTPTTSSTSPAARPSSGAATTTTT